MSDENTARHAECTVEFDGVDITSRIKPYLLSLTFTDNEEDASDDLQIKLQDREGVWMTDWLQTVSYTHLTLPTKRIVKISVVAVSIKKKKHTRQLE